MTSTTRASRAATFRQEEHCYSSYVWTDFSGQAEIAAVPDRLVQRLSLFATYDGGCYSITDVSFVYDRRRLRRHVLIKTGPLKNIVMVTNYNPANCTHHFVQRAKVMKPTCRLHGRARGLEQHHHRQLRRRGLLHRRQRRDAPATSTARSTSAACRRQRRHDHELRGGLPGDPADELFRQRLEGRLRRTDPPERLRPELLRPRLPQGDDYRGGAVHFRRLLRGERRPAFQLLSATALESAAARPSPTATRHGRPGDDCFI